VEERAGLPAVALAKAGERRSLFSMEVHGEGFVLSNGDRLKKRPDSKARPDPRAQT